MKTIKIMGVVWSYKMFNEEEFLQEHPDCETSGALTLLSSKQIHFLDDEFNIGTVRHEVRHAFISELGLESATLTVDQFEEIQCTLDQNRWEEMDEVSMRIYEDLILT